jgi:alcohol dehydrogenase YqhD (iron-dependent ADH family)
VGAVNEGDIWDFWARKRPALKALPVGCVVTIPAAGSENSTSSVLTNEEFGWKQGLTAECIRPAFSILNPELTYSLPAYQTGCGVVDMLAHIMERYFSPVPATQLTDELCEGAMRTVVRAAGIVFADNYGGAQNYDARAEIMFSAYLAHNGFLDRGRIGDWLSHHMEHELSAKYDIAHGAGLAIMFPAWMKWQIEVNSGDSPEQRFRLARIARFGEEVFGVDSSYYSIKEAACEARARLIAFYKSMSMPVCFKDLKLPTDEIDDMAAKVCRFGPTDGEFTKATKEQIAEIYRIAAAEA